MRILLSTIGWSGDVQPLVALGLKLKKLGQQVRLCVPPNFREWIEGRGSDPARLERWSFTGITPDSFLWLGEVSLDEGATWTLEQEMRVRRRIG